MTAAEENEKLRAAVVRLIGGFKDRAELEGTAAVMRAMPNDGEDRKGSCLNAVELMLELTDPDQQMKDLFESADKAGQYKKNRLDPIDPGTPVNDPPTFFVDGIDDRVIKFERIDGNNFLMLSFGRAGRDSSFIPTLRLDKQGAFAVASVLEKNASYLKPVDQQPGWGHK